MMAENEEQRMKSEFELCVRQTLLPAELHLLRGHAGVKQQSRLQELWGEDGSRLPRHNYSK